MNDLFSINSNYGHLHIGFLYIGWSNVAYPNTNATDCGEELFGIGIGRFYAGCYSGSGWCAGILNENGCLPD